MGSFSRGSRILRLIAVIGFSSLRILLGVIIRWVIGLI